MEDLEKTLEREQIYLKYARRFHSEAQAFENKGHISQAKRKFKEAVGAYQEAKFYFEAGSIYEHLGNYHAALCAYNKEAQTIKLEKTKIRPSSITYKATIESYQIPRLELDQTPLLEEDLLSI